MNIVIAGATGLLGSHAARIMLAENHHVFGLALPINHHDLDLPEGITFRFGDFNAFTDQELDDIMTGMDAFVFAAGVDERVEFKAPVLDHYITYNIKPLERFLKSAKKMGVKKAIICGSYFSYFAKKWPQMKLEEHHPYIKSRLMQENMALSYADNHFEVVMLELPYIFGIQKGRKPVWSLFVERFNQTKVIFFPEGGTAMITAKQVGYAIYHAILYGRNKTCYPLAYMNMTWKTWIKHVLNAMNQKKKVITVWHVFAYTAMIKLKKSYDKKGIEPGLNPLKFMRLLSKKTYIDPKLSEDLKIPQDDLIQAIYKSISYAYEIEQHQLNVTDMTEK